MMRQFYRSRSNRMVAGVLGGIGEAYGVDPNILRILFVLLMVATGIFPLLIAYLLAWIAIPEGTTVMTGGMAA
ncbi:MAG: PspC domain-containing protein [Armatimonadota bacterium]